MLQANWIQDKASWQKGKTLEVFLSPTGWNARLLLHNNPVRRAFPYHTKLDAQYAAEHLARDTWGPAAKG